MTDQQIGAMSAASAILVFSVMRMLPPATAAKIGWWTRRLVLIPLAVWPVAVGIEDGDWSFLGGTLVFLIVALALYSLTRRLRRRSQRLPVRSVRDGR